MTAAPLGPALVADAATAPGGWGYHLLVLLHIICAVGGFGAVAYRAFVLDLARRRSDAAAAGALGVYGQVGQVGEALIYGTAVFGIAAVGVSGDHRYFDRTWVIAALAVYVVMLGLLHGLVRPAERRYRAVLVELANLPGMKPPARPPQLDELGALRRRVGLGMGLFNLCLLGALYLMVFKP
ncbi:MAG TPA: hypothetical protein VME20_13020 [Acidimicrobiales bacterium]|nr:hypothetical protein [Acidimicrobiales bacterium]